MTCQGPGAHGASGNAGLITQEEAVGYWSASALAAEFPQPVQGIEVVGASTNPVNFGGLSSYIDQNGAEFDSAAAKGGYAVPIPQTASAYPFVQMIVGMGARAQALEEIYGPDSRIVVRLYAAYESALERIANGDLPLLAPRDTSETGRVLPRSGATVTPRIVASMGAGGRGFPTDF